ncbi:hypothetical protein [Sebaldella termitidis]|uniref:hypothetical protein n=1 Tax=Sebaldella termitidis TaxID=826 RepID=UPI003EBDAB51
MKKYKYFISFTANGMSITGNSEYVTKNQIKSIKDIHKVEEGLIKEFNLSDCKLLNYKLLDIEVIKLEPTRKYR